VTGVDLKPTASTIREMAILYVESHDYATRKDLRTALSARKVMPTPFWDMKRDASIRNCGKRNNRTFPEVPHSKIA
jgi:hypothetical protein